MPKAYFDYAATTPLIPSAIQAMYKVMEETFGNPSSSHVWGREAKQKLSSARLTISQLIGAEETEIIFTSGATESNNWVLQRVAQTLKKQGKHIISSAVEHPSVKNTLDYLATQDFEVTYLPVATNGTLSVAQIAEAIREDTILVSLMYANNETGVKFPIQAIGELLSEREILFHTDAVQAIGLEKINVKELKVDFLTATAHKFYGPKGIGFLYQRKTVKYVPLFFGGGQENGKRPGTENLIGIVGMEAAALETIQENQQQTKQKLQAYRIQILQTLSEQGIAFTLNGDLAHSLPHILNLHFNGVPSDLLLMNLDLGGFAVSAGSACSAGSIQPSPVLTAMYGQDSPVLQESIRISLGRMTTETEIEELLTALVEILRRFS